MARLALLVALSTLLAAPMLVYAFPHSGKHDQDASMSINGHDSFRPGPRVHMRDPDKPWYDPRRYFGSSSSKTMDDAKRDEIKAKLEDQQADINQQILSNPSKSDKLDLLNHMVGEAIKAIEERNNLNSDGDKEKADLLVERRLKQVKKLEKET